MAKKVSTYDDRKSKAFCYLQGPIVGCQEVVAEVAAKNCSRTCCQTQQQLSPSIKYQHYLKIHLRRSHGLSRKSRGQKGVQLELRSDFFSIIVNAYQPVLPILPSAPTQPLGNLCSLDHPASPFPLLSFLSPSDQPPFQRWMHLHWRCKDRGVLR